jgi:hypothetical protein
MRLALILALVTAVLCGCATDGNDRATEKTPKKPAKAGDPKRAPLKAGSGKEFTSEERAKMAVAWEAFKDESSTWPALREEWIALGPKATNTLVDNLLRTMILFRLANAPHVAQRARLELVQVGSPAIPTIEGVLGHPVYQNPDTGRTERLPTEIQTELNELLMICGEDAVPALIRLCRSDVPTVRRNAMNALGQMKASAAIPILTARLARADHWIDRMTAARALGFGEDATGEKALIAGLDDADEAVVLECARSLARRGATDAIPAIEKRRKKARAMEEYKISRGLGEAIEIIRKDES